MFGATLVPLERSLHTLKRLHELGLIDADDYSRKKRELLDRYF